MKKKKYSKTVIYKKLDSLIVQVPKNKNLSFYFNQTLNVESIENIPQQESLIITEKKDSKVLPLLSTSILGVGVGLAMLPIFNKEVRNLENYGINVHNNTFFFIIETLNTLFINGVYSSIYSYNYLTNSEKELLDFNNKFTKNILNLSKLVCFVASLNYVSLLWKIELENQKVDNSFGFDKFIAWATFTTPLLTTFKTIKYYDQIKKFISNKFASNDLKENVELESIGSKIAVYTIGISSTIARGFVITNNFNDVLEKIGVHKNIATPISIISGGILGNFIIGVSEHSKLKKIFTTTEQFSYVELFKGLFCTLQGGWLTLPFISAGLEHCENLNTLLKGFIFTSFFISHTNSESLMLYNSFLEKKDGNKVIMDTQNNTTSESLVNNEQLLFEENLQNNELLVIGESLIYNDF